MLRVIKMSFDKIVSKLVWETSKEEKEK